MVSRDRGWRNCDGDSASRRRELDQRRRFRKILLAETPLILLVLRLAAIASGAGLVALVMPVLAAGHLGHGRIRRSGHAARERRARHGDADRRGNERREQTAPTHGIDCELVHHACQITAVGGNCRFRIELFAAISALASSL